MKAAFRSMLLVAIGTNVTVAGIGVLVGSTELSLLGLCSAGLCGIGYLNLKEREK